MTVNIVQTNCVQMRIVIIPRLIQCSVKWPYLDKFLNIYSTKTVDFVKDVLSFGRPCASTSDVFIISDSAQCPQYA